MIGFSLAGGVMDRGFDLLRVDGELLRRSFDEGLFASVPLRLFWPSHAPEPTHPEDRDDPAALTCGILRASAVTDGGTLLGSLWLDESAEIGRIVARLLDADLRSRATASVPPLVFSPWCTARRDDSGEIHLLRPSCADLTRRPLLRAQFFHVNPAAKTAAQLQEAAESFLRGWFRSPERTALCKSG